MQSKCVIKGRFRHVVTTIIAEWILLRHTCPLRVMSLGIASLALPLAPDAAKPEAEEEYEQRGSESDANTNTDGDTVAVVAR